MRRFALILLTFLAISSWSLSADGVGFRTMTVTDTSRPGTDTTWRTLEAFLWYPAAGGGTPMKRRDYFGEGATDVDVRETLRSRLSRMIEEELSDTELDAVLAEEISVRANAEHATGQYPVVVVSAGLRSPPHTLSWVCERLAGTGYVAIAVSTPPLQAGMRLGFDQVALETMMRDIEVTLGALSKEESIDLSRVALLGWSVGSIADVLLQMRNPMIDAVVSFDGGVGYDYGAALARESIWFRSEPLDVPLLDIRALATTGVERDFSVLDLERTVTSWRVETDTLTHADITTTFGELAPRVSSVVTDERAREVVEEAVVLFLDHALKGDAAAAGRLDGLGEGSDSLRVVRVGAR